MKALSEIGVSRMRSGPKRCSSPPVALKMPPYVLAHRDAFDAVGRGARGVRLDRGGLVLGDRDRPAVVLADEEHRQAPERGEVERLVEGALVGGALAEEGHGDGLGARHLRRQRGAAGRRQAGADDAAAAEAVLGVEQVHVAALAAAQPGDLAEDLRCHAVQRHALGDGEVVRPVRADHGVLVRQVRADAHGHRFLAGRQVHLARHRAGRDVEGQPLLDLRRQLAFEVGLRQGLLVAPDQQHGLVHPEQPFGVRFHGTVSFRVGMPSGAGKGAGGAQCAMSTGSVIDARSVRVAPPRIRSRVRLWP